VSLASLPHKLPFNIGGLIRPSEAKAVGFTGVLPQKLPFTLSARPAEQEVPYGSVGWELVCRSFRNFQQELVRTTDMTSLSFSKELGAFGTASFSLNLDHPLFQQALNDGSSVESLFDYENLWEIRFDGEAVFQILGTAVTDSHLNDSEVRTATVQGSGIGKVLEWAQVFPTGFPNNIVTKLETLIDQFSGNEIDRAIWKSTVFSPNITITSSGAWAESKTLYDSLIQDKVSLDSDIASKNAAIASAKAVYDSVMKNKDSTREERQDAQADYMEATAGLAILASKSLELQFALATEVKKQTFIGVPKVDENYGRLKVTLPNAGSIYATSKTYDFASSGVSGAIEPAPYQLSGPNIGGQANTVFKISHDPGVFPDYHTSPSNYARMYTQRNGNGTLPRLVAEVSSDSSVVTSDWAYDLNVQKYWRMREDSEVIIFETSPDNAVWTERFRYGYNWPTTNVVFQFGLELVGEVGVRPPLSAYLYNLNGSSLPSTETTMQVFRNYLADAQARDVITFVQPTFTDTVDSKGRAWKDKVAIEVAEGTKLSDLLTSAAQLQQADWIMEPNFVLNAFQKDKGDEAFPPVYFLKEDVVFNEAGSQVTKERSRSRESIANYIVGKNSAGQYAYVEDTDSASKYQKREAFISAGNATDLVDLATVLDSSLEELKDEKVSWRVVVSADQPGRQVFKDYNVGDWVSIENIDSDNNVSTGQWRVVGIAISVTSDAKTTVELTLQSRRELLIERLKQQVSTMSASSASGGTTLGSAISAATLIEQAKLAGLKDVMTANAVEGDVLTYSKGYWIPVAPGDKTIPNPPTITAIFTNVYYPSNVISIRGQAQISWSIPTNTDGSVITDGHHYEIRFRPDTTGDYSATWYEASDKLWSELYTWGQPTIPPITNSGWQIIYVGWDEISTVIQELTPGLDYNIQMRTVDSSTPQHFSEWSTEMTFTVAQDTIAPPKPAPPIVASSYLAIQVSHYLGKAEGGTFNLPSDMAYLEVHVGPATFYPDDNSRIGKIIADQSLIRSGTPVIQTFNVDSTENLFVRVVAVDRTGNKSAPSNAVTSTINLIDDAHISDLTASKITAGTISASIILGGVIKTADAGARAEMNYEGFRIYSEDDDPTVSLLGTPGIDGNFLLIKDLEDPTITLAGIDGTGRGSFQSVSVNDSIIIDGDDLMTDIINPRAKGTVAIGTLSDSSVVGAGPATERGFLEISFIAEESRTYIISANTTWESTAANDRLSMRLRDAGDQTPTLSSTLLQATVHPANLAIGFDSTASITYAGTFTPGLHRILWSFYASAGNATMNPTLVTGQQSIIWVEDAGLPISDTVIINDAGVDEYQKPTTPDTKPPAPTPKVTYTKTYAATWSGTYRSNGDYSSSHGNTMVQGDSGADNYLNDARSLCGFNYKQIMADTAGSTIKYCYITLYASHWYWNDGGTARIGTHNYTGKPGSWSGSRVDEQRVTSSNWPKPGKRKVSLGTTIGNEFKTGASKGIALGPTNGTKTQYGKFNGNGQSNEPVLTIVYVK
jgi:hypothetical protein